MLRRLQARRETERRSGVLRRSVAAAAVEAGVMGVAVVTAAAVAAGRRATRALAVMAHTLAVVASRVNSLVTTMAARTTRLQRAVKAMPTAIGHLTSRAQPTRIIAAMAAAVRGLTINARSKPVDMVVPVSRHVAFPPAVDSDARAAVGRVGAGSTGPSGRG